MANLIIKPSSGGSLKLQEDGGTDALTIDASGNTTLAGTANNLGTVTAGSIAGGTITSATTFPAGHIIQINSSSGYAYQVLDTDIDVVMEVTLSNVKASSHVYISWQIPFLINTDSTAVEGAEAYIYRDASSQSVGDAVSGTNIIASNSASTEAVGWFFKGATDIEIYATESGSCIDENALTGTNVYKLCASGYSVTGPIVCGHDGLISITAMEIAR